MGQEVRGDCCLVGWGRWVEGTGEFRDGRSDRDLSGLVVVTLDVRVVVRLFTQVSKTLLLSYVGLDGVGSATKERANGQQGIQIGQRQGETYRCA